VAKKSNQHIYNHNVERMPQTKISRF